MKQVRCGVIGAGWWATYAHIPAVCAHPGARLVAVQSREQAKADRIARDFGAAHAVTSAEELLALPDLDAVIVSSTPNMHHAHAKAALGSGRHVLLEKPMTFTVAEAQELVDLAQARGVELLISCPWHFTAHGIEARRMIAAGELGRIKLVSILMTNPIDRLLRGVNTSPTHGMDNVYVEPRPGSYNDPAIAGGGQIFCQVSHAAAYLAFLTGSGPAEVFAHFDNDGSPNDLYNALSIKLANGALATVASTGATPMAERHYEVRVYGSRGILDLELWKGTARFSGFDGTTRELPPLPAADIYPERAPANDLVETVLGRKANGSPGTLGLASMEVIEAACRSAATGQNVKVMRP
jgi:predicted dehydrogenase